jgi:hypothetical protein
MTKASFAILSTLDSNPEKDSFISFTDEDGELVHLRVRDIAILEVAKNVTDPESLEGPEDDQVQGESTSPSVEVSSRPN